MRFVKSRGDSLTTKQNVMDSQGRSIAPLRSLTLDLPPSCIEFCPGHPDYFVVGTYNLQKEPDTEAAPIPVDEEQEQTSKKSVQTRDGSLVLFRLTETSDIKHEQTVLYPSAILDLHFHPSRENRTVLAVVSSTGALSFFKLCASEESPVSLKEIVTHKPLGNDESILFLSCSWHPHIPELVAITTSNYEVHVLRVTNSWEVYETCNAPVITHSLEAWTVSFSSLMPHMPYSGVAESPERNLQQFVIFSGGDDSRLLVTCCAYYPGRIGGEEDTIETPYPPIALRGHEAGVTAILPLDLQLVSLDSVVITGSYDDHIRVYAVSGIGEGMPQKPRLLAEQNLQGGVWRLKLIQLERPDNPISRPEQSAKETTDKEQGWKAFILASCMHAGSKVLEITGNDTAELCNIRVLGRFEEHKSMNYGSDFQPGSELGGRNLRCISTSFYDRLLCLWEF
ncbi:hypothetical protein GGS26DRAFT_567152 [Hypomontagnella submonticulosa]|nr:hypothetical protein GGS26DRAFT_567152 [Hypomontagnella submonticulosa]